MLVVGCLGSKVQTWHKYRTYALHYGRHKYDRQVVNVNASYTFQATLLLV